MCDLRGGEEDVRCYPCHGSCGEQEDGGCRYAAVGGARRRGMKEGEGEGGREGEGRGKGGGREEEREEDVRCYPCHGSCGQQEDGGREHAVVGGTRRRGMEEGEESEEGVRRE